MQTEVPLKNANRGPTDSMWDVHARDASNIRQAYSLRQRFFIRQGFFIKQVPLFVRYVFLLTKVPVVDKYAFLDRYPVLDKSSSFNKVHTRRFCTNSRRKMKKRLFDKI